ncbi:barttin isoform X2 [Carettochelys insculpta]|uniref:barttin isoform X2 n=1 Tax=Carettochelys insculpta TaxID=44489 RepID=UPI003EBF5C4A
MAEDKTFRYGLIVLGFFLVMIGMFIMSVDKPQITFVPMETESEKFLSPQPAVSTENEIPEKSCSQTPYTSEEEANVYETSLPSYDQIQRKAKGSEEHLRVQTAPLLGDCELKTGDCPHPFIQATADVHRISENNEETYRDPAAQAVIATISSLSERSHGAVPLASFLDDVDLPSSEGSISSSQFLGGSTDSLRNPFASQGHPQNSELPHYGAFALIDLPLVEQEDPTQEQTPALSQHYLPATASARHSALAVGPGSKAAVSGQIESVEEEDDMYYGLEDGPENVFRVDDFVFEHET